MSYADEILARLFPKYNASEETILKETGQIKRSTEDLARYASWKSENEIHILHELRQHGLLSRKNLGDDLGFIWLEQTHASGFRIRMDQFRTPVPESWFVLDLLAERVKHFNYTMQNREYESLQSGDDYRESQWYYFKPSYRTRMTEAPYEQLFGNIHLEIKSHPFPTLKVLVTSYPVDRTYRAPLPFDDLIDHLFGSLSS